MITWINCAERMPPDDGEIIIMRGDLPIKAPLKVDYSTFNKKFHELKSEDWQWTQYTEESWKELNR